ncbi:TIGR03084 family metal-binding protein [Mycolicibacterium llatzerense]|uniref:Wyosine base formation domain-containing protein n=1 Tax=Mycolicibacterium llatzerense TaxID=280871 RepID=A0A0D1LNS6_9MYCO|nr:TIGR03084 family metal-binding protein [Mycolicibacterium llatzerense]KIU17626.1 wyosine base formation domain-containing protein [Mycolicibacterium llatzerense]
MAVPMESLITDIGAETAELWSLIAELPEGQAGWDAPTPAAGWAVRDQISHLAFFDDAAVRSATDPEGFTAEVLPVLADGRISPDTIAERYRPMPTAELLSWFDGARRALVAAFAAIDPSMRVPWFGLPMSAASSLTARIMETWAHGQDIADALGVTRVPSARLRHVAHIGVGARAFSYMANGLEVPEEPVRVELTAPGGTLWTWGPDGVPNRVTGTAHDFCLLVTQRRHRDDTALHVTGPLAEQWLSIAQAFAGPPGGGRTAGQFDGGVS